MNYINDYTIKTAIDMTVNALTQEFKKQNMLQLEPTAFERTNNDIKKFKNTLELLNNDKVNQAIKKQYILFSKRMQRAIEKLKGNVSEREFILFYGFNFNNQSKRELAWTIGVDEKTVTRSINKCLTNLSILLYPDSFMDEIMN